MTRRSAILGALAIIILIAAFSPSTIGEVVNGARHILGTLVVESTINSCADAGASDAYACSLSPAITAYATRACYSFTANTANTGAATLNLNSIGAKTIKKVAGGITTDLATNDIRVGQVVDVCYDGTNMQMQSTLGNAPSGGGTIMVGAYADRDTEIPSPSEGSTYFCTDCPYIQSYTGAAWQAFFHVRAATIPPTASWSWVNQNTAAVATSDGQLSFTFAQVNGTGGTLYVRTAPATPWTLIVDATWMVANTNFYNHGIIMRRASTEDFIAIGPSNAGLRMGKWTDVNTLSSNTDFGTGSQLFPRFYRLADNGTTVTLDYSIDGVTYKNALSETAATFLGANPDQIGIMGNKNNATLTNDFGTISSWKTQ